MTEENSGDIPAREPSGVDPGHGVPGGSGGGSGNGGEYGKILAPFKRHANTEEPLKRNTLILGDWARPEFGILADLTWEWTEKVNGTNVRVIWDGHKVRFGGRTDNASMPIKLLDALTVLFPEELLEQTFGATPATLYGEGFGPGAASGSGVYAPLPSFVLFDVNIDGWWLLRNKVEVIAWQLGIGVVPVVLKGQVQTAINMVRQGMFSSWGNFVAEGLVGRPPWGILGRDGDRLMMKIKTKDFPS